MKKINQQSVEAILLLQKTMLAGGYSSTVQRVAV